eukprot:CAMPEP_0180154558 /NCGR_PEP_ID=MMETSP0986-20121125/24246_1 /TAXON_ID=697907 /ORGANISM="non described non described, Strain CCMP2293" /LENGTH=193 /DNA_ID=CAMNT_0022102967 /DNA_START=73 /DNA_END=655 /DNA_ORIENTATION=+
MTCSPARGGPLQNSVLKASRDAKGRSIEGRRVGDIGSGGFDGGHVVPSGIKQRGSPEAFPEVQREPTGKLEWSCIAAFALCHPAASFAEGWPGDLPGDGDMVRCLRSPRPAAAAEPWEPKREERKSSCELLPSTLCPKPGREPEEKLSLRCRPSDAPPGDDIMVACLRNPCPAARGGARKLPPELVVSPEPVA